MEELNNLPENDHETNSDCEKCNKKSSTKEKKKQSSNALDNSSESVKAIEKKKCENKLCFSKLAKKKCKMHLSKTKIAKGKFRWLCQTCLKAFNNNKYCYYCITIYKDNTFDGKQWIGCDTCDSWVIFFLHSIM